MGLFNNRYSLIIGLLFIGYLIVVLIGSYFLVTPHQCTYEENIMSSRDPNSSVTVLTWESQRHWAGWGKTGDIQWAGYAENKPQCDVPCLFTGDQEMYDIADAIIMEAQPFGKRGQPYPPHKPCGQKYILFSLETPNYFKIQTDKNYLSHMEWRMSYQQHSHLPTTFVCSWASSRGIDGYREPPIPFQEKEKFAIFVASNCKNGGAKYRTEYVRQLMKYIPVDSFGICLQNQPKDSLNRNTNHDRFLEKIKLFKKYKFILAFENNNVTDYVSEKLYHAYVAGSLPVYMGAPNVEEWVPGNYSLVRTDKFKSPKRLAEYLKRLAANEDQYNEYFKWKNEPFYDQFHKHYNNCVFLAECRICDTVVRERHRARQSDYPKIDKMSLATTGSMISVFDNYLVDPLFYEIQQVYIVLVLIILILYFIFVVLGFGNKIKSMCSNQYHNFKQKRKRYNPIQQQVSITNDTITYPPE